MHHIAQLFVDAKEMTRDVYVALTIHDPLTSNCLHFKTDDKIARNTGSAFLLVLCSDETLVLFSVRLSDEC